MNIARRWIIVYASILLLLAFIIGAEVYHVDPYYHFHAPHEEDYFYNNESENYQNEGMLKYFDYDALITGSSMTECFKTSELDELFGVYSIKTPISGGNYPTINRIMKTALENNSKLKLVIRSLDLGFIGEPEAECISRQNEYPYNEFKISEVYKYFYNKDVLYKHLIPMVVDRYNPERKRGVLSFDTYTSWMCLEPTFGKERVLQNIEDLTVVGEPVYMEESEEIYFRNMIEENIVALPRQYPDVMFYYFLTPYSAAWWQEHVADGTIYRHEQLERILIEEILKCPNIKLYSFNTEVQITTNLNNYIDEIHYGEWINSLMLVWMKNDYDLVTIDNYENVLKDEMELYMDYDYSLLEKQPDYEGNEEAIKEASFIRSKYQN